MWSINTSVAHVIISLTIVGVLFYIGIVAAGISSYECPFQTPVSTGLRYIIDHRLFPSLIHTAWKNTQEFLVGLSPPNAILLIYATWMDIQQGLLSAPHHVYGIIQYLLSWEISPSHIISGAHSMAMRVVIILLLQTDQAFRNAKQKLFQMIQALRNAKQRLIQMI